MPEISSDEGFKFGRLELIQLGVLKLEGNLDVALY